MFIQMQRILSTQSISPAIGATRIEIEGDNATIFVSRNGDIGKLDAGIPVIETDPGILSNIGIRQIEPDASIGNGNQQAPGRQEIFAPIRIPLIRQARPAEGIITDLDGRIIIDSSQASQIEIELRDVIASCVQIGNENRISVHIIRSQIIDARGLQSIIPAIDIDSIRGQIFRGSINAGIIEGAITPGSIRIPIIQTAAQAAISQQ